MSLASVPPVPPKPLPPGLVRVFGDPRLCTDGEVLALAFPSEETLCTVEESGLLRIWDAATGELRRWAFLSDRETLWQFTPDARYLVSAGRELCLWDVRRGELLGVHTQSNLVTALAVRGDHVGTLEELVLATGDARGQMFVWGRAGEQLLRTLPGHEKEVGTLAFSPDRGRLASAGEDKAVCVWDLPTGRCLGRFTEHADRIAALAWHPRGQLLASAGWDGTIRLWDTSAGNLLGRLTASGPQVNALAFDGNGQALAAADSDGAVRVWDWSTQTLRHVWKAASAKTRLLIFSPGGDRLAAAGDDRRIQVLPLAGEQACDPSTGRPESLPLSGFRRNWNSLALDAAGETLAEMGEPARIRLWDANILRTHLETDPPQCFQAVAFSPDGRRVAAGGEDGRAYLWDVASARPAATLEYEEQYGPLTSLIYAPDGSWLAGASAAGTSLCLWRLPEGEPAWFHANALDGCTVEALAVSTDGRLLAAAGIDWLATGGSDGLVVVWELPGWREVAAIEEGSTAVAFHPSGREIALCLLQGTIHIWPVGADRPRLRLAGARGPVTALSFSPDGQRLAAGGQDRFLRVWDAAGGALLAQVELDTQIKTLAFSPDGRSLYTANSNTGSYQFEVARLATTV